MSHSAIIRVAVIGLGWAARSIWLTRLVRHPSFAVTAVVDPDPAARAAVRREGIDTRSLASVAELDPATLDLAVLAVPNHLHSSMACELLHRGISVFVEKPVCLTAAEADQMARAEQAGPAMLLAGSAARYRTDIQQLYAAVGRIGELRHVEASWIRARGVPGAGGWFARRQLSGGGALVDLGWHLLDVIGPLLGTVDFERVVGTTSSDFIGAESSTATWRADSPALTGLSDVEDTARGFLITGNRVSVSLGASWASHEPLDVTAIRVHGRDGTVNLRCTFGFAPTRVAGSTLSTTQLGETTAIPLPDEPIGVEYDRQLDAIPAQLGDPASKGRAAVESRRTVSVIERLYDSAHQQPVSATHKRSPHEVRRARMSTEPSTRSVATKSPAVEFHGLRAIVFDMDGVLVDSFDVMREAFSIAYREVVGDGPVPFEEYRKHLGRYFPDIMRIMGLPQAMQEPFVRESYRLAHRVSLFDGIPELLTRLRSMGLKLAVATGKSGPRARSLLSQLDVLQQFDHVVGSDEIARAKPAPDIVFRALELLAVQPTEAIMVGDATTDLAAARAASVPAIAALWGESDDAELLAANPDAVLRHPTDLPALLSVAG